MSVRLADALGVRQGDLVALVGAGGKTSVLRRLGAEWSARGKRVLLSTTTKIEPQSGELRTVLVPDLGHALAAIRAGGWPVPLLLAREALPEISRLRGLPPAEIDALWRAAVVDLCVVQADGSSRRPFKAPSAHEPLVPSGATLVVAVAGADALGAPIDTERCHRPQRVADLGGVAPGAELTPEVAARVHAHPEGPFRTAPPGARRVILVNKVEGASRLAAARAFAAAVRTRLSVPVVLAAVRAQNPVTEVL